MVNMHGIAGPVIAAINPMMTVAYQASTGSTTNADGSRTPAYAASVDVTAQIQPMTHRDLQQVDGLNLNGVKRAMYLYGSADGVVRVNLKGGDLLTVANGGVNDGVWLVVLVLEQFPDWVKIAVVLQDGA